MFGFIKKNIFNRVNVLIKFSTTSLGCISMNNQESEVRPEIINFNSNEPRTNETRHIKQHEMC